DGQHHEDHVGHRAPPLLATAGVRGGHDPGAAATTGPVEAFNGRGCVTTSGVHAPFTPVARFLTRCLRGRHRRSTNPIARTLRGSTTGCGARRLTLPVGDDL